MPRPGRSALLDGRFQVLVVVLGGLFVLQSSNSLDPAKSAYFLLAIAAVAGAVVSAPSWLSNTRSAMARAWLIAAASVVVLLIVSLAVSRAHGTSITPWLRDASAYALFAAAPILALACASTASRRWLVALLAVCGALGSLSFAVEWIGRRNLASLPIGRIALPSETLAAALLALATAVALVGLSRRWWWAATGGAVLGLFFITGSRATLMLLVVPIGAAVFAGRPWRPAARVLLIEAAVAVAVFLAGESGIAVANGNISISLPFSTASAGQSAGPTGTPAPDRLGQRISSIGTLITDPRSDQSFQERLAQTKSAWEAFTSSPLLGVGPGYTFQWTNSANQVVGAFTLDTPLVYLAKFGLLGLIPMALFVGAYLQLALELWRRQQARLEYLALIGFAFVVAVVGVQDFPIEDKGASFAIILVLALGLHGLLRENPPGELVAAPSVAEQPAAADERGATGG
ncbi:MAG: O-antigen ligase family protein [Candidatus Limnocylindrales bacterium]|jgi:hypothetical protein